MGGINTKEEIIARLDSLDKEEIEINKKLRELQIELNGLVPIKDRVKVKSEYFDCNNITKNKKSKNNEIKENEDIEEYNCENEEEEEEEKKQKKRKKHKKKSMKIVYV